MTNEVKMPEPFRKQGQKIAFYGCEGHCRKIWQDNCYYVYKPNTRNHKGNKMTNEVKTEYKLPTLFKFSFNKDTDSRESELSVVGCQFYDIDQINSIFQITERDDMKGFDVKMESVTVVPSTHIIVGEAPKWMRWLIKTFCKRVII
jgi:hypothetical protein